MDLLYEAKNKVCRNVPGSAGCGLDDLAKCVVTTIRRNGSCCGNQSFIRRNGGAEGEIGYRAMRGQPFTWGSAMVSDVCGGLCLGAVGCAVGPVEWFGSALRQVVDAFCQSVGLRWVTRGAISATTVERDGDLRGRQ